MKRNPWLLGIAAIIVLTLLPTITMAYASGGENYNEHDYTAMVDFLKQPSAVAGQTNAQRLGYDISQPGTWADVIWSSDADKRLVTVGSNDSNVWDGNSLAGSLNLSGCTALTALVCIHNDLTSINVSGCTALQQLNCNNNHLAVLDTTQCPELYELNCGRNQLTSLDVSASSALQILDCSHNQIATLDVTGCTELVYVDYDASARLIGGPGHTESSDSFGMKIFLYIMIVPIILLILVWFISHRFGKDWGQAVQSSFRRIFNRK